MSNPLKWAFPDHKITREMAAAVRAEFISRYPGLAAWLPEGFDPNWGSNPLPMMSNPDLMAASAPTSASPRVTMHNGTTYCPGTGVPWDDCRCESCEADDAYFDDAPATLPSLPVATPVTITHAPRQKDPVPEEPPVLCAERYYGIGCKNEKCDHKHKLPRRDT